MKWNPRVSNNLSVVKYKYEAGFRDTSVHFYVNVDKGNPYFKSGMGFEFITSKILSFSI